ncbi:MAG: hypothetical protein NBV68_07950 [Erythrobacter sp.]|uniref:hypothetical protein n=1 Tax=Erythrobacter sp. TaxID=1042 RepID=UPI0025E2BE04|nr:hypothetical protein [Erythrobacter sp.]MCL9999299.1 hypothetical protein [Erythrobacter sp.]
MKKHVMSGLVLAASLAAPAFALEHEVVIDHAEGPIAADYQGTVTVETRQVGTAGVAGRPSTLACQWNARLEVERVATLGEAFRSQRMLREDNVANGTRPGWCETQNKAIDRIVEGRRDTIRTAMLALVEQDRAALLAEADSAASGTRG